MCWEMERGGNEGTWGRGIGEAQETAESMGSERVKVAVWWWVHETGQPISEYDQGSAWLVCHWLIFAAFWLCFFCGYGCVGGFRTMESDAEEEEEEETVKCGACSSCVQVIWRMLNAWLGAKTLFAIIVYMFYFSF